MARGGNATARAKPTTKRKAANKAENVPVFEVHCTKCLHNGPPKKGSLGDYCANCKSEDIFTAKDLIQGTIDRAYDNRREGALWCFVMDEWEALEKRAKQ